MPSFESSCKIFSIHMAQKARLIEPRALVLLVRGIFNTIDANVCIYRMTVMIHPTLPLFLRISTARAIGLRCLRNPPS